MEFIRDIFRLLGSIFFIIIIACGINSCVNEKRQMAEYHNSWEYHVKQKDEKIENYFNKSMNPDSLYLKHYKRHNRVVLSFNYGMGSEHHNMFNPVPNGDTQYAHTFAVRTKYIKDHYKVNPVLRLTDSDLNVRWTGTIENNNFIIRSRKKGPILYQLDYATNKVVTLTDPDTLPEEDVDWMI